MVDSASSPESGEMLPSPLASRKTIRARSSSRSHSKSRSMSKSSSSMRSISRSRSPAGRRRHRDGSPHRCRSKRSQSRSTSGSASSSRSGSYKYAQGKKQQTPVPGEEKSDTTVYVGRLSIDTDERALRSFFQAYGTVLETKVVFDPDTHKSRCFGFVKFSTPREADAAVSQAHGKGLDGSTIRCNLARYPSPTTRRKLDADSVSGRETKSKQQTQIPPGGRSERKYRRSVSSSPEGASPHRTSRGSSLTPPRQSPRRSYSRSQSHSRQRGRRQYSWSKSPSEYGRGRRYRSRSPGSRRTRKQSVSSEDLGQRDGRKPILPGATNKELMKVKLREKELLEQVDNLEVEMKKGQVANDRMQKSMEGLSREFKAVVERSKNRGRMLTKLLGAVNEVDDLKAKLKAAECALADLTRSAIELLQAEEVEFAKADQKETDRSKNETEDKEMRKEPATVGDTGPDHVPQRQEEPRKWSVVENGNPGIKGDFQQNEGPSNQSTPPKNWKPLTFKFNL